jgi:hypothetical protein
MGTSRPQDGFDPHHSGLVPSNTWQLLGFDTRGLMNSNEDVTTKTINLRTKHVARDMELSVTFQSLKLGAHASLFIVQNQCFYYNIINVSNYLPH